MSVGASSSSGQREHPGHVERHISVPDHDHPLDRDVEMELLVVGMAVVPGDELGGRPRARQVLARNPQPAVGLGADGVDDGVVETHEVGVVKVAADLDVAEKAEARPLGDPLEGTRHRLQLRMVGSDAEPDEAPRRRQALDQVHLEQACPQTATRRRRRSLQGRSRLPRRARWRC